MAVMTPEVLTLEPVTGRGAHLDGVLHGDLQAWTERYQDHLLREARAQFQTIIPPDELAAIVLDDINPKKKPRGKQHEIIRALRWCVANHEPLNIIAEQGSGKTKMTINGLQPYIIYAWAQGIKFRVLVVCPSYLLEKWAREFTEEVEAARSWAIEQGYLTHKAPHLQVLMAARMADLDPYQPRKKGVVHPLDADVILSTYEDISLGHRRIPSFIVQPLIEEDGSVAHLQCACPRPKEMPPCCPGHTVGKKHWYCGRHHGPVDKFMACPSCFAVQYEIIKGTGKKGDTKRWLHPNDYGTGWRTCVRCKAPLWQAVAKQLSEERLLDFEEKPVGNPPALSGPRKLALDTYLRNHVLKYRDPKTGEQFSLQAIVVDEVHLAKSAESARGMAAGNLLGIATHTRISLTATATGGYASSIFTLGQRTWPTLREEFGYKEVSRFVNTHGVYQKTVEHGEDPDAVDVGAISGRKTDGAYGRPNVKEIPGISPGAYTYYLRNACFARLDEIFDDLPEYHEEVWTVALDDEIEAEITYEFDDPFGIETVSKTTKKLTQKKAYQLVESKLRSIMMSALADRSIRYTGMYRQNALRYQNVMDQELMVYDPVNKKRVIARVSPFPSDILLPKEERILDAVVQAVQEGIQSLIYVEHVHAPDVSARLKHALETFSAERLGRPLRVAVLRVDDVPARRRESFIAKLMENADVMICSPKLVEMGLDLTWARRIIWAQQITSLYTMSQASRRSWRPGVQGNVLVSFALYEGTTEMPLAKLMAEKMRIHAQMSGKGQYDAFATQMAGAMDLTTILAERLSLRSRDLFVSGEELRSLWTPMQYTPFLAVDEDLDDIL